MCLGIPMQVIDIDSAGGGAFAWCECRLGGQTRRERLNVTWLDGIAPGEWVHAVLGVARERLSAERAAEITSALEIVQAALLEQAQ